MTAKKRLVLLLCLFACLLACVIGLTVRPAGAEGQLSQVEYQESYALGSTLEIQDATIKYNGEDYPTKVVIKFPSGKTYSDDSIVLNESGAYTIEYKANANGVFLSEKVEFTVGDSLFEILGNGSVSYGANDYLTSGVEGFNVSLNDRSTLRYNKVIDVSDNSKTSSKILKFYCTPATAGELEVERIIVTLTDAEDPSNFVEVVYKMLYKDAPSYNYVEANANGQDPTGLHAKAQQTKETDVFVEGFWWTVYRNSANYGAIAFCSWDGVLPKGMKSFEENSVELNLDNAEKRVYIQRGVSFPDRNLCTDLDDPSLYGDNPWGGFKSGKVVLTLRAERYQGGAFNFFITEVDGHNLKASSTNNDVAPTISVDFGEYDENNLPSVVTNKACDIFPATALDEMQGEVVCNAYVYYNYNNSARTQLTVKNGQFTPTRGGIYTILYKAVDSFGNVATKTVDLFAIERERIEYELTDSEKAFTVGDIAKVSDVKILNSLTGYTVKISARHIETGTVYPISNKTLTFQPIYSGDYKIEYEYSDYVESVVFSYDVSVQASLTPLYLGDVAIPEYFIKGAKYFIPDYNVYDYTDGMKEVVAEKFVKQDDGELTKMTSNYITVTAENSVQIVYKAGENDPGKSYSGKVVDTNYGESGKTDLAVFMQAKDGAFDITHNEEFIEYATDQTKAVLGVASLDVINPAYFNLFDVDLSVNKANFNRLIITLTARNDRSNFITVQFDKSANGSNVTVKYADNEVVGESLCSFGLDKGIRAYVENDYFCVAESDIAIPVEQMLESFDTFFFVNVKLEGVSGESAIRVNKLMNQPMGMSSDMGLLISAPSFEVVRTYDYAEYTAKTNGDLAITVDKNVVPTGVNFVATVPTNKGNFESLVVELSAENGAKITVSYSKINATVTVTASDAVYTGACTSTFGEENGVRFRFYVSRGKFIVENAKNAQNSRFDIATEGQNGLFECFKNGDEYLPVTATVKLEGVSGDSALRLEQILGGNVGYPVTTDIISPVLVAVAIRDDYKYGDFIEIPAIGYYDFVDPSPVIGVEISDGKGNYLVSSDEIVMNGTQDNNRAYSVPVNVYMEGYFAFYIYDYSMVVNGQAPIDWMRTSIIVKDDTAPVLDVNVKKTTYKVGDTVKVATATVTDDNSEVELTVSVIDADGVVSIVDKSFKAKKKGEYTIIYMAIDADGNASFYQYVINVK